VKWRTFVILNFLDWIYFSDYRSTANINSRLQLDRLNQFIGFFFAVLFNQVKFYLIRATLAYRRTILRKPITLLARYALYCASVRQCDDIVLPNGIASFHFMKRSKTRSAYTINWFTKRTLIDRDERENSPRQVTPKTIASRAKKYSLANDLKSIFSFY